MIRFYFAFFIAKLAYFFIRAMGKNATHLPGRIAIKLCPDFLKRIAKPEKIICVTGTNGKTTTNNMIIDSLKSLDYKVLDNNFGSNIDSGIASSLIKGASLSNKNDYQIGVFEVDERSSLKIYPYINPNIILCTNLFRDSIKRNAHPEFISKIINSAISEKTILILNSDDIISSNLGTKDNIKIFYNIEKQDFDLKTPMNIINDQKICPKCHNLLEYNYSRYHHIGNVYCKNCGFKSEEADISVSKIDFINEKLIVRANNKNVEYKLLSNQIFNIYNEVAVITALYTLGIEEANIQECIKKLKIVESRYNETIVKNTKIIGNLCKGQNPVALSCVFDYLNRDKTEKQLILILDDQNDAKESSENSTWIYDADFEFLNAKHITKIVIGGKRAEDFYLRLLLAGTPEYKLAFDFKEENTYKYLDYDNLNEVYILYDIFNDEIQKNIRNKIVNKINGGRD